MFQVPLSFSGLVFVVIAFFVWLICALIQYLENSLSSDSSLIGDASCATSDCCKWVVNLRRLPFYCDMAHL